MTVILIIPVVALAMTATCFYLYRKYYALRYFTKDGIPGPEPNWLFGNLAEMADESKRHLALPNWTKKYGKVYGIYEGSTPVLITSDTEVVMQVAIKQFHNFHGRKDLPRQAPPDSVAMLDNSMLMADGERWKRLRTIANPTFSTGKLRMLMPLMNKAQSDFLQLIDYKAKSQEAFNIFECFKLLTLDTISETAFGIELNGAQNCANDNKSSHPVSKAIDRLMNLLFNVPLAVKLAVFLPEFEYALHKLDVARFNLAEKISGPGLSIIKLVTEVIQTRKASDSGQKRQDLLQMMMDQEYVPENNSRSSTAENKGLTIDELSAQAGVFFVAGYETTSNALAFTCFQLAKHPEAQERLSDEINQKQINGLADYDTVASMKYLDCVINETMRLFPVALIITRKAMEDSVVNGLHIPKGLCFTVDIWSVHRSEEHWGPVDVEQFHPERFLDEYPTKQTRPEAAFMPFGIGPRICIGMRFALLEIKLTLVNILRKYRIEATERTGDSLNIKSGVTMSPADGVFLKLVKRRALISHADA